MTRRGSRVWAVSSFAVLRAACSEEDPAITALREVEETDTADRATLIAFYSATGGPNWEIWPHCKFSISTKTNSPEKSPPRWGICRNWSSSGFTKTRSPGLCPRNSATLQRFRSCVRQTTG